MVTSEIKKGELAIFGNSLLGGLLPIVTILSYSSLSPTWSLIITAFFITLLFAPVLTVKKQWKQIASPGIFKHMLAVVLFISLGYYTFYYWGLKYTSAGNAIIISRLELFFSYLLFHVWKKEEFSGRHLAGAVFMLLGALMVMAPASRPLNRGDLLVLCAAAMAPIGNLFQRKIRESASSATIMFWRSLLSLPFLAVLAVLISGNSGAVKLGSGWAILAAVSGILLGVKTMLWLEGIHRIPITKANAITCITPAITLILAFFILHQTPRVPQLLALLPIAFGLVLLTTREKEVEPVA